MLHSPSPISVQLYTKAFKKMKNLKFLMARNVLISKELNYLPNGLKLLEWDQYPSSLPSHLCPQKVSATQEAIMVELQCLVARCNSLTNEICQMNTCIRRIARRQSRLGGFVAFPSPSPETSSYEDGDSSDEDGDSSDDMDVDDMDVDDSFFY